MKSEMDLINRSDAINELMNWVKEHKGESFGGCLFHWTGFKALLEQMPSANLQPTCNQLATDCISRQAVLNLFAEKCDTVRPYHEVWQAVKKLPSVEPEIPPYVAEIEAKYKKWINVPYIKKPLAKALYEVWKKHDMEDAERKIGRDNDA